ncbi:hypothetical protein Cmtc_17460 [Cupriavidus sp. TKC]|nr:hypothetical protein Cmtc_17460 [Cupriavidus sp. TKC]
MRRVLATAISVVSLGLGTAHAETGAIDPSEARAIAKEAYVYGFPLVDSYRVQYAYFVDAADPEFKAPWNHLRNVPRVYTPADRAVQSPNSDTPYSWAGLDLRAEPVVLTLPPVEQDRYFSVQIIDAYTFSAGYLGSRTTGNGGGNFLIAGPDWYGETPAGVQAVIRSETPLAIALYRTQLFGPKDLPNVEKVQAGYRIQPLSTFLGQPTPSPAPAIAFPRPLTQEAEQSSLAFFDILNFLLQYCPPHASEKALLERFSRIGVVAGRAFRTDALPETVRQAIADGMADAWREERELERALRSGTIRAGDILGSREHLRGNYAYRMLAAKSGIYGVAKEEAIYPIYASDANGKPLDGASGRYTMRFGPGDLPPVNAFWSLTMYEAPARMLVDNPIQRYLLNSPMLSHFRRDPDGGVTFVIQHESPGTEHEANWLPAPRGPFVMALRLYWPKAEALSGKWKQPPVVAMQ